MSSMQFIETFDKDKLFHILQNKEKYTVTLSHSDNDPFLMAQKYLNKSSNGIIKVAYHQTHSLDYGRFFSNGSTSLQNLTREIRQCIAYEYYDDIDMVNAHPTILLWLCNKHKIDCDNLNDYIVNREKHIADLVADNSIDRGKAKNTFIALINGGTKDYSDLKAPTKFIKRFKIEVTQIVQELCVLYPKEFELRSKEKPHNPHGSTVNIIMCEWENQILQQILAFYTINNIITNNCVLCFDGVMIPKHPKTADLLPDCEKYVFQKLNIKIDLKIKPMLDGFVVTNPAPYIEPKPFDQNDPFVWIDFDRKYRDVIFASYGEIIEKTAQDLNRVFCRVEQGQGLLIKKDDCDGKLMTITDASKKISDMHFKYMDGNKQKKMKFNEYIQEFANSMNRYNVIDFSPNSKDPNIFNLWTGFIAHTVTIDMSAIALILSHIKEVFCKNDQVSYDYFLDLLYYIIKYPERPVEVSTFIYSKTQGTGKNIILTFLQNYIFGDNMTLYTAGLNTVLGVHNNLLKNKKIIIVDEIATSGEDFMGSFDRFKSMQTGPTILINPKGTNEFTIKNVLGWFLLSNHDDCLRIEPTDRRYFCLSVDEKYAGDKEYFKRLGDTFSKETGNIFYSYLLQRGDSRNVNIRIPPINDFKRSIISKSWNSSMRYLFEIKTRDEEYGEDRNLISATELYNNYKQWAHDSHEKIKSQTKFFCDIKDSITKTKTTKANMYDLKTIIIK